VAFCSDLTGDSYTFGRGEMCDYQFSTDIALTSPCYQAYSKVHFKVTKVISFCFVSYWTRCNFLGSALRSRWPPLSHGAQTGTLCNMLWNIKFT